MMGFALVGFPTFSEGHQDEGGGLAERFDVRASKT
jgi:hypothetical protein